MIKQMLREIVIDKKRQGLPNFVIKNFLKEYLQYPALDFIYNNKVYNNFIFTGGSCLRVCFNAPRLSEDLDFDLYLKDYDKLNLVEMGETIKKYFRDKFLLDIAVKCQSNIRLYLKLPILKELELADVGESDFLYVKIEPTKTKFANPDVELTSISQYGFNFIARNYTLPYLMTGKLLAILSRQWFQGKDNQINIKGRDFYDLYWYWQKGVLPDFKSLKKLTGISSENQLKARLLEKIDKEVTPQKLAYDLKNFFPDQNFVSDFCKNYKVIIAKFL